MKLQLILVQQNIDTYAEVKELTPLQRKQIEIELKAYFGKKISLREAFDGECILNYWQVVSAENLETILYDFWEMNAESGGVFVAGTTKETGVEMIQGSFDVQVGWTDSEEAHTLADALSVAERKEQAPKDFEFNESEEVIKFVSADFVPKDPKEWNKFLKNQKVNETIIRQYHTGFNKGCWNTISEKVQLSEETMLVFGKKINWDSISQYQKLSEEFIRVHHAKLNWTRLSMYQKLSEGFIREFQDQVNWDFISGQQKLSEVFIREFLDRISWTSISWSQELSLDFMREFHDTLKWDTVLMHRDLPETALREFMPKFDWSCWHYLCMRQNLSIEFINEFSEKINWGSLSHNQNLTAEHLRMYKDKLDWNTVIHFGAGLPESLLREFEEYISRNEATRKINWKTIFTQKEKFPVSKEFEMEIQRKIKS